MGPTIAKVLRQYAVFLIPKVVSDRWPNMSVTLHRKLKTWWNTMPSRNRHDFFVIASNKRSLPEEYRVLAYQAGIILDWPPKNPKRGRNVKRTSYKTKGVQRKSLSEKLRIRKMVRARMSKGSG